MLVVRPAGPDDFDALMELAVLSGRGFTSLPANEPTLRERLGLSQQSFRGEIAPIESWYTLMLEDFVTGKVLGVAGIHAAVGLKRPFFSFRVVTLAQASASIGLRFDHKALVLVNECAGWTEVGSLFLRPDARAGGAGRLLAQSRYLLIASEPQRFSDTVLAELRGFFEEDGTCPFWEHVSRKFFRLPFDEADLLSASTDGQFILDLAPRQPIYLELLPQRACEVVGEPHRDGQAALAMLKREGFRYAGLVDIFDAGPTVTCPRDDIRTVRESRRLRVRLTRELEAAPALVAVDGVARFRCLRAPAETVGDEVTISWAAAEALNVRQGDLVRVMA